MRLLLEPRLGEVRTGLRSRAGAGDIALLAKCAVVVEEDEGALDGRALGGVAGEGVAVLEVVGAAYASGKRRVAPLSV